MRLNLGKFWALSLMVLALGCAVFAGLPTRSAQAAEAPAAYKLGAGDKIRLITFGEDALTGEFFVSGAGKVALPLIGEVQASGLTTTELQTAIASALSAGYVKDPRVSVEVLNFRPFYILGEVNKPGAYAYEDGMTVFNAVATASGFTYRANAHKVIIKHAGETGEHEYTLNASVAVRPGDTIRIKERLF